MRNFVDPSGQNGGEARSGLTSRYLALTPHLTVDELHDRYWQSADPVLRSRYQILWRLSTGQRCPQVATETGSSAKWIRRLVGRYNAQGPAALGDGRHASPGRAPPARCGRDGGAH
ncbi:MAG TPA: helix-turn-helix domain-containing protein [Gemmatimonadales bacterium]|nr:helix-turn-helix domain-containing protein [Gemmatimonadales bacterium]